MRGLPYRPAMVRLLARNLSPNTDELSLNWQDMIGMDMGMEFRFQALTSSIWGRFKFILRDIDKG